MPVEDRGSLAREDTMVAWTEQLRRAQARLAERDADPWRGAVEKLVRNMDAVGTAPLLDLLGLPKTTGNARRIAKTMRSLGYVPMTSRRLMPGGFRDTVTRGWSRPVRSCHPASRSYEGDKMKASNTGPNRRLISSSEENCHVP